MLQKHRLLLLSAAATMPSFQNPLQAQNISILCCNLYMKISCSIIMKTFYIMKKMMMMMMNWALSITWCSSHLYPRGVTNDAQSPDLSTEDTSIMLLLFCEDDNRRIRPWAVTREGVVTMKKRVVEIMVKTRLCMETMLLEGASKQAMFSDNW